MIYPVELPIEVNTIPDGEPVSVMHFMRDETRYAVIRSLGRPRLHTTEQLGVRMELSPVGSTTIRTSDPISHWYDAVGAEGDGGCWLLEVQPPGAGEYNISVFGLPPGTDVAQAVEQYAASLDVTVEDLEPEQVADVEQELEEEWPLTLLVSDIAIPEVPTLPSRFGTHSAYPVDGGYNDQQVGYDWITSMPAYIEARQDGATEREGYVAVYQQINDDMQAKRLMPYMAHYLLSRSGDGWPQFGDFYDCETKTYEIPALGHDEIKKFPAGTFAQQMGYNQFNTQPGVWALCGVRQDRIAVAAGDTNPETGEPYTVEEAAALTAANLAEWEGHLDDYYVALIDFAGRHGYIMQSYFDEPGPPWSDEALEMLRWTLDAARRAGWPCAITITGAASFEHAQTYGLDAQIWIIHHDTGDEWLTEEHLARLPEGTNKWAYLVWDDAMMVDLLHGHRHHPGTGQHTADDSILRFWLDEFEAVLFWSIINPASYWASGLIDHWLYEDGWWSLRLHRWAQAMALHDWLVATAAQLGEQGRELLIGYIMDTSGGFEAPRRGEALRALLYDLCEEIEPIPEYRLRSVSDDRIGEIRIDWDGTPWGRYKLWQTLNTDLSLDPEQVPGWLPATEIEDYTYYVDILPDPGEAWRYRVDYWDGDNTEWVRMLPDMVGQAAEEDLTLHDKLRAAAQTAVEAYGVRITPGYALYDSVKRLEHWPNINESGDARIPDVEHDGVFYRFVRSQHPEEDSDGNATIHFAEVGKWYDVIVIPQHPNTTEE